MFHPFLAFSYIAESNEDEVEEVNVEDSIEFASSSELHDMINFNIFEDIVRAKPLRWDEGRNGKYRLYRKARSDR